MELGDIEHPRETLGECQKHLKLLQDLQEHVAWPLLCRYLADSAGHLEAQVLRKAVAPDMLYQQEFIKGKAMCLRDIPEYVAEYCDTLQQNIKRILYMMQQEMESERRDDSFDYRTDSAASEPEPEPGAEPSIAP